MAKPSKATNEVDAVIGRNVRRIRLLKGMTQEGLGDALKLTFQQVQKYEKGTNRIGGSRAVQIANALHCRTEDLFQGTTGKRGNGEAAADDPAMQTLTTTRGVRLARAFNDLTPNQQSAVVDFVERMAGA